MRPPWRVLWIGFVWKCNYKNCLTIVSIKEMGTIGANVTHNEHHCHTRWQMLGATIKTTLSKCCTNILYDFVRFWAQLYIIVLNASKLFSKCTLCISFSNSQYILCLCSQSQTSQQPSALKLKLIKSAKPPIKSVKLKPPITSLKPSSKPLKMVSKLLLIAFL